MAQQKYLNYSGLTYFKEKLDAEYASIKALEFKGVRANIAALPTVANEAVGNMYTVTTGGTTTADFVEGAGKTLQDGENVVAVNLGTDAVPDMKWDILGGVFEINDRLQFGSTMPADPEDGQTFLYMGDTTYTYSAVTGLTGNENPHDLGYYEEDGSSYVLTSDTEPIQVYKAFKDASDTYFVKSATPQIGDTVYTISGGTVTDSGYTVDAVNGDIITVNGSDYTRSAVDDEYIDEKTYYTQEEQYVTGVIYVYNDSTSSWDAQGSGDTMIPISNGEIDALFD